MPDPDREEHKPEGEAVPTPPHWHRAVRALTGAMQPEKDVYGTVRFGLLHSPVPFNFWLFSVKESKGAFEDIKPGIYVMADMSQEEYLSIRHLVGKHLRAFLVHVLILESPDGPATPIYTLPVDLDNALQTSLIGEFDGSALLAVEPISVDQAKQYIETLYDAGGLGTSAIF